MISLTTVSGIKQALEVEKADRPGMIQKGLERISDQQIEWLEGLLIKAVVDGIPIDRLEAICQAEREGRCVVLPCKEGDTVYFDGKAGVVVDVEKCTSIRVRHGDPEKCLCAGWDSVWKDFASDDFGRTVFLARAQAEAAKAGDRHD